MKKKILKVFIAALFVTLFLCCLSFSASAASASGVTSVSVSGQTYQSLPTSFEVYTDAIVWYRNAGILSGYVNRFWGCKVINPDGDSIFNNTSSGHFAYGTNESTRYRSETVSLGSPEDIEGRYIIYIYPYADRNGSDRPEAYTDGTYYFYVDRTAPTGTLSCGNGGLTNQNVTFAFTEGSAKLNDSGYSPGSTISSEGTHTIVLTDTAGNSSTYTFTIDKTAPAGFLSGVSNGGITNSAVSFWFSEGSAKLNGSGYSSGSTISSEGSHTIVLTDTAGNSSTYTFTIDKTAPTGTLNGVANGGAANGNVTFSFSEGSATLNGSAYSSGATISTEGSHTIVLTDSAGNRRSYSFTIDKTAPTGTLHNVTDGGATNSSVYFSWSESNCTATLNGQDYTKNEVISDEGSHTIVLTDAVGNSSTYTFTIDLTAPTGTLHGVAEGGITNGTVYFTWSEATATATLNGVSYTKGILITDDNSYTLVLKDTVGNASTYTFTIDTTPEIPTIHTSRGSLTDGSITNQDIWITWNESTSVGKIRHNGGAWESYLKDYYYDSRFPTVKYDTQSAALAAIRSAETETVVFLDAWDGSGTVYGDDVDYAQLGSACWSYDGYIFFRQEIKDSYLDSRVSSLCQKATKNYISEAGSYEFVLTDVAGNSCTRSFTIDKTAPTGELSGVTDGGVTNGNVTISWTEDLASVTVNGSPVSSLSSKQHTITSTPGIETIYQIVLTDVAGNTTTYTYTLDTLSPAITLKKNNKVAAEAIDGIFYYKNSDTLSFNVSDTRLSLLYLNETSIEKGSSFSIADLTEGVHYISATDTAGNVAIVYFTVDKTAPTGTLSGVVDGGVTNGNVYLSWTENNLTVICNGGEIRGTVQADSSFKYLFSADENTTTHYSVSLTDLAGNIASYSFSIDKTPPVGSLYGVVNGGATNGAVTFSWSDLGAAATLDGSAYISGTDITDEGSHTIILTDAAGNSAAYTFKIDVTPPTGTLSGVTHGGVTNSIVKLTWSEIGCSATLNNVAYTKNSAISAEGYYSLVLKDAVGNTTTYSFQIDLTAPEGTLSGVTHGGITNNSVRFAWSEKGATATLDGYSYISGTAISSEGIHTIILTDAAGNAASYTFEIDLTAPTGTLSGVTNGGATNATVSFSWLESTAVADLNGSPFASGTTITAEGSYTLVLTDEAGNSTTYTFSIDVTAPTGTLSGVANGSVTNQDVSFSWKESGTTATLNGEAYSSGSLVSSEGSHTIILTDAAGNSSTYTFSIDKTPPTPVFSINPTNTVGASYYFSNPVSVSWTKEGVTAQLDGNNYIADSLLTAEGTYGLILTDAAGNSVSITIVIDTTPFTQNYNHILSSGKNHLTKWYQTYYYSLQEGNYIKSGYYSFSNAEDALTFSVNREMGIVETGGPYSSGAIICAWAGRPVDGYDVSTNAEMMNNNYHIYYSIEDATKLIAYFNYSNLLQAVNHYAQQSIETKYVPSTPATAFPGNETVPAQTISRAQIFIPGSSLSWRYSPSDVTLYVNGSVASYDVPLGVGWYNIREVDFAGNVTEYIVVVDSLAPQVIIYDASGNRIPSYEAQFSTSSVYCCQPFTMQLNDNYDTQTLIVVTFDGVTQYFVGEAFTFSASGIYTVKIYDVAGNTASYTVYLSLEEPTVSENDVTSTKGTFLGKDVVIDTVLPYNQINSLTISRYDTESSSWVALTQDANGTTISSEVLSYFIASSGDFKVTLTDNFGRTVEKSFSIYKDAPVGKLFSADGIQIPSGTATQKIVYFFWEDDSCTALINGLEYTKKALISDEGSYVVTLTDLNGVSSSYTFSIDKSAPTGTLSGVTNGGYTNQNVSFTWDANTEAGTVAYISRDNGAYFPYTKDSVIANDGYYRLKLVDAAGNESVYSFRRDTVAPTVSISTIGGTLLQNGSLTNQSVFFQWSEGGCSATLNGEAYSSKKNITETGTYTFHIRDAYGNFAIMSVTIDKNAPTGELSGVANGSATNKKVSFSWSELGATATLNGESYTGGAEIAAEGLYTIVLSDPAGNATTYSFQIDLTAPTGTLSGVADRGVTNGSVSFTWSEIDLAATLNGAQYNKRALISAEGVYSLVLTDAVGNATTYTFEIDLTAPTGSFTADHISAIGELYFKKATSFVWSELGATATLNGKPYTSGNVVSDDGTYTVVLTDEAGNATSYTFIIDTVAPVGYFSSTGHFNNSVYLFNSPVYLTWSESGITAKLDGEPYTKRTTISDNGEYTITLSDTAGNAVSYTFVIDTSAPEGEFVGNFVLQNNTYYFNSAFGFVWSEVDAFATLDGNEYESGSIISDEGFYTLVLTDAAGNRNTFSLVLDTSAPVPTFSSSHKDHNGTMYFNQTVSITWNDNDITATLNGQPFSKRTTVSQEGTYTLILTDAAGNNNVYSFVVDLTAPTLLFSDTYTSNFSVLYFKTSVEISWDDTLSSATLNGNTLINRTLLSAEGTYDVTLIDRAGNEATYYIVVDKTAPEGSLIGVTNGGLTNTSVAFTWQENGATATLNGAAYKKSSYIYDAASHEIILSDIAGNVTVYTFTIDFELPVGTLTGVVNGGVTNSDVFFTWSDSTATATLNEEPYASGSMISAEGSYTIVLTSSAGNSISYSFSIDRTAPEGSLIGVANGSVTNNPLISFKWNESNCTATLNGNPFDKREYISGDGSYTIILTDAAGNSSTYTFSIDTTAPVGALSGVSAGGVTNGAVSFSWSEGACAATLNGQPYVSGQLVSAEGVYTIVLSDGVGNSSTYTFSIDKTAPTGTLNGVVNGGVTNGVVTFSWSEAACSATLNGEAYTKRETISNEGHYELVIRDPAGNVSFYVFEIDLTAPMGTLNGVANGGSTNGQVSLEWYEEGVTAQLNGNTYSSGTVITDLGIYTITLTDVAGNSSSYTFTIDNVAPEGTLNGVANGGITNSDVYFSWIDRAATATLNGVSYAPNTAISIEGTYTIILVDNVGNSSSYNFSIDKSAPTGIFSGSYQTIQNILYFKNNTSFVWYEQGVTCTHNNESYVPETAITAEGSHTIILTDAAGNSTEYRLVIDKKAPTGTLTGVANNGITNTSVTFTWEETSVTATLNEKELKKGTTISAEGDYLIELSDLAGNRSSYVFTIDTTAPTFYLVGENGEQEEDPFTLTSLLLSSNGKYKLTADDANLDSLKFNEEVIDSLLDLDASALADGSYTIIATDRAGNSSSITVVIDKTAPTGSFSETPIETDGGQYFTTGIKFSWEENDAFATLNGEAYRKNATIYADGLYTMILSDAAGNSTTYTFTLLLSEPTTNIIIPPLSENEEAELVEIVAGRVYTYNRAVSIALSPNAAVYINGELITSDTALSEPGEYKIVMTNAANVSKEFTISIVNDEVAEQGDKVKAADIILIVVGAAAAICVFVLISKNLLKSKKIRTKRL